MIAGQREQKLGAASYRNDPLYAYAKAFVECANNILNENTFDYFAEPTKTIRNSSSKEALKEFFTENFVDDNNTFLSPEDIEDLHEQAEEQFENDMIAMESAYISDYAPMVGMALPIHKLILMNNVFSQGNVIQKVTAVQPNFTVSLERRILVTPEGKEIDFFLQQNEIADAINATAPVQQFELTLPQLEGQTDILGALGGTSLDELSITTHISGIFVANVYIAEGDHLPVADANGRKWYTNKGPIATAADAGAQDVWFPVEIPFTPYYGGPNRNERILNKPVSIKYKTSATDVAEIKDTIVGTMNNSKLAFSTMASKITKIMVAAKLDTSNAMLPEASFRWKVDTDYVEIPEATPVNTTVTPEEVKDIAACYDANQVTKIMSMTKTALSEKKDKEMKDYIWNTYEMLDERASLSGEFDFAVPEGYALDWVTFRQATFMDYLDDVATQMLQVLNDPNMIISIVGDPRIVRKLAPKDYTYQAPAAIGPVTLDYVQTIVNQSDKRVYNFVGSDKLRNTNELMIILNPRNTERICFRLYDYQLYISNEIRNSQNPVLPAIHAFERYRLYKMFPVMAKIDILNPKGLRN